MAEGTSLVSRGDAVLDAALSEMVADGTLDESAPVTEPTEPAATPESGASPAAVPAPAGDAPPADPVPPVAPAPAAETPAGTPAPAAAEPVADPLAGTEPLLVNGKPFDGIFVEKGVGAVIPADKLDAVTQALDLGERARVAADQLWQRNQEYEGLVYQTTKLDENGKSQPHEYRGLDAFRNLEIDRAKYDAAGQILLDTTKALLAENPDIWKQIQERLEFAVERAGFRTEQSSRTAVTTRQDAARQEQVKGQALDIALGQLKTTYPIYTAEDLTAARVFLQTAPEVFFRPATAQEAVTAGIKPGELLIDYPRMQAWANDRAALRTGLLQQEEARKAQAAADQKAGKFNAGQDKGRQPVRQPAKAPAGSAAASAPVEKVSRSEAWEKPLQNALAEMGVQR